MKDKKKLIILSSVILGVLVSTLGLTYTAFTYNKTGETSKLVLGDIWMKYTENNQLILADAMPMDINNYTTYKVNPAMKNQEVIQNELSRCVSIYNGMYYEFDKGSTAESFCQGTGTAWGGITIQEDLDAWIANAKEYDYDFLEEGGQELLDAGVILANGDSYIVNPVMATQEVIDNELSRCVTIYTEWQFNEGSTAETYCQGTGFFYGRTFQELLDIGYFNTEYINILENNNVIVPKIENLPYFEFTISGKNTYEKEDIWYDIVLTHGDEHETRTTRIRDELLRFTLIKIDDDSEKVLFSNSNYNDLSNQKILSEKIKANTTSEVNNKYRLYMWISDDTIIGNVDQDYTMEEWNDVFASIKVNVNGNFLQQTDESCFTYEFYRAPNPIMQTQDETDETTELYKCIQYFTENDWGIEEERTPKDFCLGNAVTEYDQATFDDLMYWTSFNPETLLENNVIIQTDEIKITGYDDACGSEVVIPRKIDGYEVKRITGYDWSGYGGYGIFSNKNVTSVIMLDNIKEIGPVAFSGSFDSDNIGLKSIVIPDSVTRIAQHAFSGNQLTSVVIPNSVTTIEEDAFSWNSLMSVKIPDSVTTIGRNAFHGNQLKTVTIGNGIRYIGKEAFVKESDSNPNLESITFTSKTCEEIEYIPSTDYTFYFPWLYYARPFYREGYEATIIGIDGICSY